MYLTPTAYSTSHLPLTMTSSTSEEEINGRTGSDKLFPGKLHDMLDHAESEGLQHVVSWSPDGKSFTIHKPKQIIEILPMFFGHSKYRSFHRQLNMWSFRRLGEGPNRGAFTHPYFIKGQKAMCRTISRHRFRSVPTDTESPIVDNFQQIPSTIRGTGKGITRSPSQVSLESSNDAPTSKEESSFQPFLRDGDVATFEGMTFHFVGRDIDIF
eukprot:Nitzschia sp. Nitz4//scaffold33_size148984//2616//3251//NITZ4_002908-RA/size148984-processed-gene-0.152-mRNA-1//-1//CDS//3329548367//3989//frame0